MTLKEDQEKLGYTYHRDHPPKDVEIWIDEFADVIEPIMNKVSEVHRQKVADLRESDFTYELLTDKEADWLNDVAARHYYSIEEMLRIDELFIKYGLTNTDT